MNVEDARAIQFLRSQVGLTYRRMTEWWCHSKGVGMPNSVQEFGQLLCSEAEATLGYTIGSFDSMMREDTFEE